MAFFRSGQNSASVRPSFRAPNSTKAKAPKSSSSTVRIRSKFVTAVCGRTAQTRLQSSKICPNFSSSVAILRDRPQHRFNLRRARFEQRRQRQFFADRFHRLVGGKARPVGRDLEQDAVRLAEIQAAKIKPVDLARVADAEFIQPLRPGM